MKIAHGTLVLAADGEKMLLFRNEGDEKYPVLETLAHEQGDNPPSRDQGADAPGRSFQSAGDRRSALGGADLHSQAEEHFAAHAAAELARAASRSDGDIVVIAAPRALGELRRHWSPEIRKRIVAEIDKDVAHQATDDVVRAIEAHLA